MRPPSAKTSMKAVSNIISVLLFVQSNLLALNILYSSLAKTLLNSFNPALDLSRIISLSAISTIISSPFSLQSLALPLPSSKRPKQSVPSLKSFPISRLEVLYLSIP